MTVSKVSSIRFDKKTKWLNQSREKDHTKQNDVHLGIRSYIKLRGGGVLPCKRLIGMCRWMGSHFHDWNDYNGVTFSIDLLEWGRKFSDF